MRDILYVVSRWLFYVILLLLACYLFYSQIYLIYGPKVADVDARLPTALHASSTAFWSWFGSSAVLGGGLSWWLLRVYRAMRHGAPTLAPDEANEGDQALVAATQAVANLWQGHEGDPAFLILAEGDSPLALIGAAGLGPDAVAPDDPAPIRGFRTADGVYIQCGGPDPSGARSACSILTTGVGTPPPLRAILIQVPVATLLGSRSQTAGSASRALLRAVAESIATRCPVYVVVSGMEDVPGFLEFARRSPADYRTSARFGFTIPSGADWSPLAVAREYDRLIGWYNLAILDFMEAGPLDQDGNEALFSLGRWFVRIRESLLNLLEAARPGGDDPLDLANCYFVATGATPEHQAFVESLMRVKVASDDRSARWSVAAIQADRTLRRMAVGLGAIGGTSALAAWVMIFSQLRPTGWLDVVLVLSIVVGWGAGWYELLWGFRQPRR